VNKHPTETQLPTSTKTPHNKAPEELVSQVLDAVLQGEPVAHVARQFGITRRVVYKWIAREALEMREAKDALYAGRMDKLLERILNEADTKDLSETSLRDLVVSMGIVADKRERFHGPKPPASQQAMRLQISWKDGTGALALDLQTTSPAPLTSPSPPSPSSDFDDTVDVEGFTVSDEGEAAGIVKPVDCGLDDDDPRGWGE